MTREEAIKFASHAQSLTDLPEVKEFYALAESALREQEKLDSPLSAFLAPMDSYKGLKRKFLVFKSDTGEMIENCFVLRPGKDPAAVAGLRAYAEATDNDTLAADIISWVGAECNNPLTLDELREMDGEPVWCVDGCGHERWCLVSLKGNGTNAVDSENGLWWGGFYCMDGDGNYGLCNVGWIAFRHKPKEAMKNE